MKVLQNSHHDGKKINQGSINVNPLSLTGMEGIFQRNRKSLVKPPVKPRRRTRFIPTMVKVPPSIFDRTSRSIRV